MMLHRSPTIRPNPVQLTAQWQPVSAGRTNHLHLDVNRKTTQVYDRFMDKVLQVINCRTFDPILQNVQGQPVEAIRTNHLHTNINLRMT